MLGPSRVAYHVRTGAARAALIALSGLRNSWAIVARTVLGDSRARRSPDCSGLEELAEIRDDEVSDRHWSPLLW
jgi:hypothetical protein